MIYRYLIFIGLSLQVFFSSIFSAETDSKVVPRTIIALYDSEYQRRTQYLNLHQLAEMPLNHLGFQLQYHDIQMDLPDIKNNPNVVGILNFLPYSVTTNDPQAYIQWSIDAIDAGKKFVVMGNPGFDSKKGITPKYLTNRFWEKLGLRDKDMSIEDTYEVSFVYLDYPLMEFERKYSVKPSFNVMEVISKDAVSHAIVQKKGEDHTRSDLVVTHPNGGYVAANYSAYKVSATAEINDVRKWYINPFEFFRLTFDSENFPKPDTTTLAGRRIYYSHIDGDGWNNVSDLEKYREQRLLSAEVVYKEILLPNQDLPVTVGPIAADIDENWVGNSQSREIARIIFSLPCVEPGCHTFTHPFEWQFFKNYTPKKEEPYLRRYPNGSWRYNNAVRLFMIALQGIINQKTLDVDQASINDEQAFQYPIKKGTEDSLNPAYYLPRAYALKPFNLETEVFDAIKVIESVSSGRPVVVYQWSGDCMPFERAIQLTREAHVRNLNGGDSRFDQQADSYGWVKPVGRKVGNQQQIYSSNSNENTYTDMWTKHYYGMYLLPETFKNTETPLRIKPMNLYYHIYSGEKQPSLNAILKNIEYVRSQEMIPITAGDFAAIGDGFFTTIITKIGDRSWKIENRGKLQTIRYDHHSLTGVDFSKSSGVVGQRHFQGSLYVYLDEANETPVIALKDLEDASEEPLEDLPYLIHSSWKLWNLKRDNPPHLKMKAQGYGSGTMVWKVPTNGKYRVKAESKNKAVTSEVEAIENTLKIYMDLSAIDSIEITMEKI